MAPCKTSARPPRTGSRRTCCRCGRKVPPKLGEDCGPFAQLPRHGLRDEQRAHARLPACPQPFHRCLGALAVPDMRSSRGLSATGAQPLPAWRTMSSQSESATMNRNTKQTSYNFFVIN